MSPAKGSLDALAPLAVILAVYRLGDVERDTWCVARYGEVDEFLDPTASMGEQPVQRISWETSHG